MENISKQNLFKTFWSYCIPCIIGMFLTSFITVVDGIFIGRKIGENGLAAVNLTLPVLYNLLAVTIMIGAGGVTLAAQSLGEKNRSRANHYFSLAVGINVLFVLAATVILILFWDDIIPLLNAKGILSGYVRDYLGIMRYFYVFMMLNLTLSIFIRSEGKPQLSLVFGVVANILNIILDYWLIIRLNYGMKGAALASGISVLIPFLLGICYFLSRHSVYKFQKIRFRWVELTTMLFYGSAEFIGQISISFTTYLLNWLLLRTVGINGVAALTIVGYVSFIQNMIFTGIAVGIHPVISYHYGAKNAPVILGFLRIAQKVVTVVGMMIFLAVLLAGNVIVQFFAGDNLVLQHIASHALKLFAISFLLSGFNIIAAAYFTSLGEARQAATISILRSLVLIIILVWILPMFIGEAGIWLTPPVTEFLTFIVAYLWVKKSQSTLAAWGQSAEVSAI
ncbi:MAG TPA: MATE family efflux transporter [Bacillota bacterium]|nr:MATE family efflux transporter [Bacillota bacterium]